METAELTDLYQASYYLLSGCEILNITCSKATTGTNFRIHVQGTNLATLAQAWADREAVVNLWAFRTAYTEINTYVQQAKRRFELSYRFHRVSASRGGRS